ncbi:MAG: TaqI-like C-terminal specificity domain-containing protein, partial [Candidatus Omnitrophota bacterium]
WDIQINYGIKTGYNEAFIIDGKKKDELIAEDPKSAEIIRPILRGRDIKRFGYDFADLWLINTHNGLKEKGVVPIKINNYLAIKRHLDKFYPDLKKRADQGVTPYNLRNCAYMEDFFEQKIVWARLMRISKIEAYSFPRFALVPKDIFIVDSLCFFVGNDLSYLQGILNSEFAAYYFFNNISVLDNGGMQMRQQFVENIPIPQCTSDEKKQIKNLVAEIKSLENMQKSQQIINDIIYKVFGFSSKEIDQIKEFVAKKYNEIINSENNL